ncbi:hypothetical protein EV05_0690 [Prochlorococcus sp. MIT 0601]|nr:hypothetical protein EV05_0690 [Prochlorococcus sp. MIT 0601]
MTAITTAVSIRVNPSLFFCEIETLLNSQLINMTLNRTDLFKSCGFNFVRL